MRKKLLIIFALLFMLLPVSLSAETALPVNTVNIHYYRYSDDYANDWNFWLWPQGGDGERVDFVKTDNVITKDSFGAYATVNLTTGKFANASRIGILIRRGEWVEKDVSFDRFIEVPTTDPDGILDVYFVEGDERVGYSISDPNGPDKSDKIKNAYFSKENTITFNVTTTIAKENYVLKENGVTIPINVSISGTKGTATLNKNLDFGKEYQLCATFTEGVKTYDVTFDGIYDSQAFENAYGYEGNDLGSIVETNKTKFRLWAPISNKVVLNIFDTGSPAVYGGTDTPTRTIDMTKDIKGTWKTEINENLHGKYYTYSVTNGSRTSEVIDPYAKSAGVNGIRGMIVDFTKVNPEGFEYKFVDNITNPTDAIIYELHVRDLTVHSSWNGPDEYRGKFLGLTVEGTKYEGVTTGLDHIKELGVTHVQLLPFFDFGVVDESRLNDSKYNKFNWGYMPLNFNVPEGSYSTNPYDGAKRITELKQVVNKFTDNNIGLIMDVVYNHTGLSADSNFNLILPGYYHRLTQDGSFSNGSGTGNETASERYMVRKFMVDSTVFWAKEYNLAGFRFDLMALHDVETMAAIANALKEINPDILIYGEPWNGGATPLSADMAADKLNLKDIPNVGAFNDDFRDGIKGSVFTAKEGGFIQGLTDPKIINRLKYGIVGGVNYPDLGLDGISYSTIWHLDPTKTINYVSAHDNNTLYDKLKLSTTFSQREFVDDMQKQANAIVLTSQGIPFLHAGVEFMRSKPLSSGGYDHNSYESPDSVNQLRWDLKAKTENLSVFEYYKGLISLRKAHPAFRMATSTEILDNLTFMYEGQKNIISYKISNYANGDTWGDILVIHNSGSFVQLDLPEGEWNLVGNSTKVGNEVIKTYSSGSKIGVLEHETVILYQGLKLPEKAKKGCLFGASAIPVGIMAFGLIFLRRKNPFVIGE